MIYTCNLDIDRLYLQMPVRFDAPLAVMKILVDGTWQRKFAIKLAKSAPDYSVFAHVEEFIGQTIEITYEGDQEPDFSLLKQSDVPLDADDLYAERYRQQFHFSTRRGFINDPNGLVFYKGNFHLFYQHNPFETDIGIDLKHWGHAISSDLVHWKELPEGLYPDYLGSMYSGSAVVDWSNTSGFQTGEDPPIVLMYTAEGTNADEDLPFTQCIATSTDGGQTLHKYPGNPTLGHIAGSNRDPGVFWHEPSKAWRMALYLDKHVFAIFSSNNLVEWTKLSELVIAESQDCPDVFKLPVDGDAENTRWVFWVANTSYVVGDFDGERFIPETEVIRQQPEGSAYAAQTWRDVPDTDGRRIQIAWFITQTPGMPFTNCMTVPVVLSLKSTEDGPRLHSNPIRELETLRTDHRHWSEITLDPALFPKYSKRNRNAPAKRGDFTIYPLGAISDCVDIECEIDTGSADLVSINLRGVRVVCDARAKILTIDQSVFGGGGSNHAGVPISLKHGIVALRILLDRVSIEVFADDGRVVCQQAILPSDDNFTLAISSRGGPACVRSLDCWRMSSVWR